MSHGIMTDPLSARTSGWNFDNDRAADSDSFV
jgi:hypothetical protein